MIRNNGFSLVELSIVLVILGLLTGGILTGQSLIRAAELRAVTTEAQGFATAVNTFKQKYFVLPGDMANATDFWTTNTEDGDGNGIIEENSSGASDTGESFMFWNQLALAGLINGQYSGRSGTSDDGVLFGQNVPASKISSAGYQIIERDYSGGTSSTYAYNHINALMFGAQNLPTSDWAGNAILLPEEAWNIDTKMDDGKPATGKIISIRWNDDCDAVTSGVASATNFNAAYNLAITSKACTLVFRDMFN